MQSTVSKVLSSEIAVNNSAKNNPTIPHPPQEQAKVSAMGSKAVIPKAVTPNLARLLAAYGDCV